MAKQKKYKGISNPAAHQADVERKRSGAWGTHADSRTKRARTRDAAKRRALGDQALTR